MSRPPITRERIIQIARLKGYFEVSRYRWRDDNLRRRLRKMAKSPNCPLKFDQKTNDSFIYVYAPEKLICEGL